MYFQFGSSSFYFDFLFEKKTTCSYAGASDKTHGNLYTVSQIYLAQQGNDQALMEMVDKLGPIAIAMDASSPYFNSYSSGIFASPKSPAGIIFIF